MSVTKRNLALVFWCLAITWAVMIFRLSSQSEIPQPTFWMPPFADKLVHAAIYGILSSMIYAALCFTGMSNLRAAWMAIILASLYGVTDEWHQYYVENRNTDIFDWIADTVGASIVLLAAKLRWPIP